MKKLFMKRPTIYWFLILLIWVIIIYLVDIKLFLVYILLIYLIDSNIKTNLLKKSLYILNKQNEIKMWSIGEKMGVDIKDFMKEIEIRWLFWDEKEIKKEIQKSRKEIFNILDRILE